MHAQMQTGTQDIPPELHVSSPDVDLAHCIPGPAVQLSTFAVFASLLLDSTNTVDFSSVPLSGVDHNLGLSVEDQPRLLSAGSQPHCLSMSQGLCFHVLTSRLQSMKCTICIQVQERQMALATA